MALAYLANHWSATQIKEIPADVTCTDLPQTWHKPRGSSIQPDPIMSCTVAKADTDCSDRKKDPLTCILHKACTPTISQDDMQNIQTALDDRHTPFSYLLQPASDTQKYVQTVFGKVPIGSTMGYQLTDVKPQYTFTCCLPATCDPLHNTVEYPSIPLQLSSVKLDLGDISGNQELQTLLSKIQIDIPAAHALHNQTIHQSLSERWRQERQLRLTASNFGSVVKRKIAPSEAFVRNIFKPQDLKKVVAVSYGQNRENIAKEQYMKKMTKRAKHVITVYEAGLCVNPSFPHLGATPDGRVLDRSVENPLGLLEIKCPYKYRDLLPSEAAEQTDFCLEFVHGELKLKTSHAYYYQVQGQMAVAQVEWCDFAVYTTKGMHVQRINFNRPVWQSMFDKLTDFYFKYAVPFLKTV